MNYKLVESLLNSTGNDSHFPMQNMTKFDCTNTTAPFLWHFLGFCVMDIKGVFAVVCGIASIVCWIIYGLPQMIMNCKKGIPDEAMSPWLLIFWTVGDTSNMIGAILTKQLVLQIAMAGYAIFCDLVLISQYTYAVLKRRFKLKKKLGPQTMLYSDPNNNYADATISVDTTNEGLRKPRKKITPTQNYDGSITKATGAASLFCLTIFFCYTGFNQHLNMKSKPYLSGTGRTLLSVTSPSVNSEPFMRTPQEIIGYTLGCLSTLFYCSGRFPQIFKNLGRKCTEGLSVGLFLFAMLGNGFYGAQIFLTSIEKRFLLLHLPWVVGSWGVMLLDSFILFQFFIYRNNKPMTYEILSEDEDQNELNRSILVSINDDEQLLVP